MRKLLNLSLALSQIVFSIQAVAAVPPVMKDGLDVRAPIISKELSGTPATPASGQRKLYPKSDGFYQLDSTGTETKVGSGAGGGSGIPNDLTNGDAETNTTGWATYADAAGTSPVDGTGGSPVVTWTRTTSSPLRGIGSFLLTKGATNRQGDGASNDFSIPIAEKGKRVTLTFDYAVSSGTFASADVSLFVYDVTNGTFCATSGSALANHTMASAPWVFTFDSRSNSTSYRLILHVASTSALAYTLEFDNFILGTSAGTTGPPQTDWVSYTPTFAGLGTVSSINVQSRRVGPDLLVRGSFVVGTSTAVPATMSLGYDGANSNVTVASGFGTQTVGWASRSVAAVALDTVIATAGGTTIGFGSQQSAGSGGQAILNGSAWTGSGQTISFNFTVPIAGWSSGMVLATDSNATIPVRFRAAGGIPTGSLANASFNPITYGTVAIDNYGKFSSGVYTIPKSAYYDLNVVASLSGGFGTYGACYLGFMFNGSGVSNYRYTEVSGTTGTLSCVSQVKSVFLTAGTTVQPSIEVPGWSSATYLADSGMHEFSVVESTGPSQTFGLSNLVLSSNTASERIGRALVSACTASPCSITNQTNGFLSSITRSATGTYAATFATPFADIPACVVTGGGSSNAYYLVYSNTITGFSFQARNPATAANVDDGFNIICMSAK